MERLVSETTDNVLIGNTLILLHFNFAVLSLQTQIIFYAVNDKY